ncbi:MAG: helix-turn-helix domain-containing protein [Ruminococcus sp.]|nr:helix-turn-helix domain-containing protein [Ruminococcus sp.]
MDIKFLSTKEVAKALGCSLPTARQLMLRYDFPLIRVGRAMKVEEHAFLVWSSKRRA